MGLEVVVLSSSRVRDWLGLENGESCLFEAFLKIVCATRGLQLATLEPGKDFGAGPLLPSQQLFLFLSCMEEGKASRGAYWREGSGMAVSLGRSEAKSFHAVLR